MRTADVDSAASYESDGEVCRNQTERLQFQRDCRLMRRTGTSCVPTPGRSRCKWTRAAANGSGSDQFRVDQEPLLTRNSNADRNRVSVSRGNFSVRQRPIGNPLAGYCNQRQHKDDTDGSHSFTCARRLRPNVQRFLAETRILRAAQRAPLCRPNRGFLQTGLPSQKPNSLMRCPCGQVFDSHKLEHSLIHVPHITAARRAA